MSRPPEGLSRFAMSLYHVFGNVVSVTYELLADGRLGAIFL